MALPTKLLHFSDGERKKEQDPSRYMVQGLGPAPGAGRDLAEPYTLIQVVSQVVSPSLSLSGECGWSYQSNSDEEGDDQAGDRLAASLGRLHFPALTPWRRRQHPAAREQAPIPTITLDELIAQNQNDERTFRIVVIFGILLWFVIFGDFF